MLDATPQRAALLEVNNIEVIYNHVILVLKGVSLSVPKGAITALLHDVIITLGMYALFQFDVTPPMGAYPPSSLVDFLAGREVEVDAIWGEPLRRAQAAGVAVPRLAALEAELRRLCSAGPNR